MTNGNSDTPQQLKPDHLKEALRSVEWKIEQQNKTFDSIERKAVMLITLYVSIIGFFGSLNIIWVNKFEHLIPNLLFLLLILLVAIFASSDILNPRPSEKVDNNSEHFLREFYNKDFNLMMQDLLKDRVNRYNINVIALNEKTKLFKESLSIKRRVIICVLISIAFILLHIANKM